MLNYRILPAGKRYCYDYLNVHASTNCRLQKACIKTNFSTYPKSASIQNILFKENMENVTVVKFAIFLQVIVVVKQITCFPNG